MTIRVSLHQKAQLRRADWRFLLPTPPDGVFQHLVLLGGPPRLGDRLVKIGAARRVSCHLPGGQSADAVAVLHDAEISPQEASACLLPGGVFYYEVYRGPFLSRAPAPNRFLRGLRAVGLEPTGIYAVSPNFDASQIYLPLNAKGALRWYVTTLYQATSIRQRLLEAGLRAAGGLNSLSYMQLMPYYAVTAAASRAQSMAPSVLGSPSLPAELRRPKLRSLMLTDGGNRVTMLPFDPDGRQPVAILKIPKLPDFNGRTMNEQGVLTRVRSQLDEAMSRTLPQPLGFVKYGDITASIESYIAGQSLLRSSSRWGLSSRAKINDLRLAADWLAEFHRQTENGRSSWGEASVLAQWIEAPIATYRERFGLSAAEERLFACWRRYAESLSETSLPIVCLHRDFNVWNIFRAGNDLNVIDWEGGRPGPPLCDLLHFVTHWNESVRSLWSMEAQLRGFRALFLNPASDDVLTRAVHTTIVQYMRRLDIDHRFLPLLLVYTWVELALRRYEQQRDGGDLGADTRAGNRNFAFIALLAEQVDQLFGGQP